MMPPRLRLTIPGRWPSANEFYEQRHWSARSATIHDCHDRVWAALHEVDDLPALPLAGVVGVVTIVWMTGTLQDADNVLAKATIDGLVKSGVLRDDSAKYVRYSLTTCRRCEAGDERVEVLVVPAAALDVLLTGVVEAYGREGR